MENTQVSLYSKSEKYMVAQTPGSRTPCVSPKASSPRRHDQRNKKPTECFSNLAVPTIPFPTKAALPFRPLTQACSPPHLQPSFPITQDPFGSKGKDQKWKKGKGVFASAQKHYPRFRKHGTSLLIQETWFPW